MTQFNMFNTDESLDIGNLQVNCLHYYFTSIPMEDTEKIEYCLGPIIRNESSSNRFINFRDRNFTFAELHQLQVTSDDLLSWSATIDLAERYQHYINHWNGSSTTSEEIFYNCTRPWFGPRCEYSFGLGTMYEFETVLRMKWRAMEANDLPQDIMYVTCYTYLQCDRGGPKLCLDWREICDGHIDCIDGGLDEARCYELEVNECESNEYRCHNGLCIDHDFIDDESPQCLDTSDLKHEARTTSTASTVLRFDHEEHICRFGTHRFSCGDGTCVPYFHSCSMTQRHQYLIESISKQGDLPQQCWIAMLCLTKIQDNIDGLPCRTVLNSSTISSYLQSCDTVIQFPLVPVLFGHVHFLYHPRKIRQFDMNFSIVPDYICYDRQQCDFLTPTYFHDNHACRQAHEIDPNFNMKPKNWPSLVLSLELYFHKCSNKHQTQNYSHYSSLYCCKNSTKCIAKSRILDGISDCYLNDDEEAFELSCSIGDSLRLNCTGENKCYSTLFQNKMCSQFRLRRLDEIKFEHICDRVVHLLPMLVDGVNHTDETECENWPCNNHYTRCDGHWTCPNGEDEENCTTPLCPVGRFPCVLLQNHTFTCLPAERVSNGHIDCLGATDEMDHCLRDVSDALGYDGFRCLNDTKCLLSRHLCNEAPDCPHSDDERFCFDSPIDCGRPSANGSNNIKEAICRVDYLNRIPFSFNIMPSYPPLLKENFVSGFIRTSEKRRQTINFITQKPDDPAWPWRCHHGVYVREWLGGNKFGYRCFCPPNFYGEHCQYQNQRVALALRIRAIKLNTMTTIVVTLIDDDDEQQVIESYNQITSTNVYRCENNFNFYLTYGTRPKNVSRNYTIRIDAFDRISLAYICSWYFKIPFSFLPVHRLAKVLTIPTAPMPSIEPCPVECLNGHCMKYINEEKYFCRCHAGWSGVRCNITIRCSDCSNDSICVGMIRNRSICVCPLHKGGSRCFRNFSCVEDICDNGGQCFVANELTHFQSYGCMCPIGYTGELCQFRKYKLHISFNNTKVSPFVLLYFYGSLTETYHLENIRLKVVPYKITMFQTSISEYFSIPLRIVFVKVNNEYYLAVFQRAKVFNVTTTVDSKQRCAPVNELFNSNLSALPEIRRIKHFHMICQTHRQLKCFFDEFYMCLCSNKSHAHCFNFEHTPPKCKHNVLCQNGADCWQDYAKCPTTTLCACKDCFFGDRCQFYGKGIGLTLDDIFRYEVQPNVTINEQSSFIKSSIALTTTLLVFGLINSGLSIMTFRTENSQEVGCGIYLFASSITSLLTVSMLTAKFWFLMLTQTDLSISREVFWRCCISLEFILKVCLYTDNWFNGCVALERLVTTRRGVRFNKAQSKSVAYVLVFIVPLIVAATFIHEPLNRDIFDDKEEQRLWCALRYSPSIHIYNMFILLFHFIGPLVANLASALYIIFGGVRRRAKSHRRLTYSQHLRQQLKDHKNLIISPIILVILALPRLIISLLSGCVKASHSSWLYLIGYIISFLPSVSVFIIFVLPSKYYMAEFKSSIRFWRT